MAWPWGLASTHSLGLRKVLRQWGHPWLYKLGAGHTRAWAEPSLWGAASWGRKNQEGGRDRPILQWCSKEDRCGPGLSGAVVGREGAGQTSGALVRGRGLHLARL